MTALTAAQMAEAVGLAKRVMAMYHSAGAVEPLSHGDALTLAEALTTERTRREKMERALRSIQDSYYDKSVSDVELLHNVAEALKE